MRLLLPASFLASIPALMLASEGVDGAAFHRNSILTHKVPTFGRIGTIAKIPRGGADAAVEEAEAPPEVLYLPGLLDVELKKSSRVGSDH